MGPAAGCELSDSLEGCGHLCAATGRPAGPYHVGRAYRAPRAGGDADAPADVRRRDEPLRRPGRLGAGRSARGGGTRRGDEPATAAEYALMLTDPAPPQARRQGWRSSAPGNTNWSTWSPRAAPTPRSPAELFISVRTVRTHLDRIRDKTGARRRADLTRLALQANLI